MNTTETCENCGRRIGKLEPARIWRGNVVCVECHGRLSPAGASATGEYRALGLNSRKTAVCIALVGLFLSPILVGIPLIIWGCVADSMLNKHQKAAQAAAGPLPPKPRVPLKFKVSGLRADGKAGELTVDAETKQDAISRAEAMGLRA